MKLRLPQTLLAALMAVAIAPAFADVTSTETLSGTSLTLGSAGNKVTSCGTILLTFDTDKLAEMTDASSLLTVTNSSGTLWGLTVRKSGDSVLFGGIWTTNSKYGIGSNTLASGDTQAIADVGTSGTYLTARPSGTTLYSNSSLKTTAASNYFTYTITDSGAVTSALLVTGATYTDLSGSGAFTSAFSNLTFDGGESGTGNSNINVDIAGKKLTIANNVTLGTISSGGVASGISIGTGAKLTTTAIDASWNPTSIAVDGEWDTTNLYLHVGNNTTTLSGTGTVKVSNALSLWNYAKLKSTVDTLTVEGNVSITAGSSLDLTGTSNVTIGGYVTSGGTLILSDATLYNGLTFSSWSGTTQLAGGTAESPMVITRSLSGQKLVVSGNVQVATSVNLSQVSSLTINQGGVFDTNGFKDTGTFAVTLAGGTLTSSVSTGTTSQQLSGLTVNADSTVHAGTNISYGIIASGYGNNTLNLNEHTLTKTGAGTFYAYNSTISNGTLKIAEGTFTMATAGSGKTGPVVGASDKTTTIEMAGGTLTGSMILAADSEVGVKLSGGADATIAAAISGTGTLTVEQSTDSTKNTLTLSGAISGGTINGNNCTLLKGSIGNATIDKANLGAAGYTTISGTVNLGDMYNNATSGGYNNYSLVGSGTVALNIIGDTDLTTDTSGNTKAYSKIGMNADSTVTVKSGGHLTAGAIMNTKNGASISDLKNNASAVVEEGGELTVTDADTTILPTLDNSGTASFSGTTMIGALVNSGELSLSLADITMNSVRLNAGSKMVLGTDESHNVTLSTASLTVGAATTASAQTAGATKATLNANLKVTSGGTMTFNAASTLTLGCTLTIEDNVTLNLGTAASDSMVKLFDSVETLTVNGTTYTATSLSSDETIDRVFANYQGDDHSLVYKTDGSVWVNTPEPATATLSLLALAGLCARRRRK